MTPSTRRISALIAAVDVFKKETAKMSEFIKRVIKARMLQRRKYIEALHTVLDASIGAALALYAIFANL